eukprot:210265-Pelagomonas_calceolata.AAC.7
MPGGPHARPRRRPPCRTRVPRWVYSLFHLAVRASLELCCACEQKDRVRRKLAPEHSSEPSPSTLLPA